MASGPTRTLGLTKRLYRRSLSSDMATAFEDERNATALISTTADRYEGVASFVERRPPNFIGDLVAHTQAHRTHEQTTEQEQPCRSH